MKKSQIPILFLIVFAVIANFTAYAFGGLAGSLAASAVTLILALLFFVRIGWEHGITIGAVFQYFIRWVIIVAVLLAANVEGGVSFVIVLASTFIVFFAFVNTTIETHLASIYESALEKTIERLEALEKRLDGSD